MWQINFEIRKKLWQIKFEIRILISKWICHIFSRFIHPEKIPEKSDGPSWGCSFLL
jgi:hypothetical protein